MEPAGTFETDRHPGQSGDSEIPLSLHGRGTSADQDVESPSPLHFRFGESMPEGMLVTDEAGTILYANPPEERTFGYAGGELIGMRLTDLSGYPDEENDQHIKDVFSELHLKGTWSGEWLNKSKEGTRFCLTARINAVELEGRVYFIRTHPIATSQSPWLAAAYHLAAVVDSSDDAIISKDLNGIITSWNRAAERMFGYSAIEAIGQPITMLAAPDRVDEMSGILEQIREGGSVRHLVTVCRRKDGTGITLSLTVSPIRDAAGAIIGASTIARDITQQRRLEEATLHLAAIVDGSDDAIVSKDLNGIIRTWNKSAERIFGYSSTEAVGQPISMLAPPDRLNEMPEVLEKVRKGERIDHYETRRRRKDGGIVDISLTVSPIRTSSGEIIGASKIARDISEQKYSQEALEKANVEIRESEMRFRTLANAIPQLCWMARDDGSVFWFNDRWVEYTGKAFDQDKESTWQTVHDPATLQEMMVRWKTSVASSEPFEMVVRIRGRTGVFRSFLSRAIPVKTAGGEVLRWFGTSTDIEEQKTIEDTLHKTNESLRRANESLAQFAYVAAHDLQEPLRTVVSFSQLVQRKSARVLDPESEHNLACVVEGAQRMNQLISDLLDYSRTSAATHDAEREVDLEEEFIATLAALKDPIERENARIAHEPLPHVFGDASQLRQVFQNLLSNSLKYHRDGVIPEIDVKAQTVNGEWLFSVTDNGQGFRMKYAEQIFGIFKRLHGKDVPGSGMGLAICKAIIERHGGTIRANSEVGHGTTFYFTLPKTLGRPNAEQQVT